MYDDREVPFSSNEKCDTCGKVGAYDFMGDFICENCLETGDYFDDEGYSYEDDDYEYYP